MKNTGTIALILVLILTGVVVYNYTSGRQKKIGVLQYHQMVYEYKGMKEATEKYTEKMDKWNKQTTELEEGLKKLIEEIKLDSINKDKKKLNKDYQAFLYKRQSYYEYKQKLEQKAMEEDRNMTLGVINQVNEHLKAFAEEMGYDVIVSNTQEENNIGYVNEKTDVTKAFLDFANKRYTNEK